MFTILILYKIFSILLNPMERQTQIIIGTGVALTAIIGYAIYLDISRFFPKKGCDKSKCKDNECC